MSVMLGAGLVILFVVLIQTDQSRTAQMGRVVSQIRGRLDHNSHHRPGKFGVNKKSIVSHLDQDRKPHMAQKAKSSKSSSSSKLSKSLRESPVLQKESYKDNVKELFALDRFLNSLDKRRESLSQMSRRLNLSGVVRSQPLKSKNIPTKKNNSARGGSNSAQMDFVFQKENVHKKAFSDITTRESKIGDSPSKPHVVNEDKSKRNNSSTVTDKTRKINLIYFVKY